MNEISIIIPVYNDEKYIVDCLNSINNQTYKKEIYLYIIDDCSTDKSLEVIENFNFDSKINVKLYKNKENKMVGYSRNKMISLVNSKYVLFLDSDDMLEITALERCIAKAEDNNSDIVFVDWILIDENLDYSYRMHGNMMTWEYLIGDDCANILSFTSQYTTNALYRTDFIKNNNISYGEGYFYEDFEFIVQCAMKAHRIDFIHFPLYEIRYNKNSITKSNYQTRSHLDNFYIASEKSISFLYNRSKFACYFWYRYLLFRCLVYTKNRAPHRYRYSFLKKYLNLVSKGLPFPIPQKIKTEKFRYFFGNDAYVIKNKKVVSYLIKDYIEDFKKNKKIKKELQKRNSIEIISDKIVILESNLVERGNAKYLYNILKTNKMNVTIISDENYSENYYYELETAKYIVIESWNKPLKYNKKEGQKIVQLSNGFPIKKELFATYEIAMLKNNSKSLKNIFKNYLSWDYFLIDNLEYKKYFDEIFLHNKFTYIYLGQPKIKYLLEHYTNYDYIEKLRNKYRIEKPLILYVPTFRDSNIFAEASYKFLDIEILSKKFPQYQFRSILPSEVNKIAFDIQELLLICDGLISDYSSIIFDAAIIGKKIILYHDDIVEFERYRGIFKENIKIFENICFKIDDLEKKLSMLEDIEATYLESNVNYNKMEKYIIDFFNKGK